MSNFALLETKRGKPNKISRSAEQEITDSHHRYDPSVVDNKVIGYVPTVYDREANEFPKMLYHPDYGKTPEPEQAQFAVGAVTQQQLMNAAKAYQDALAKWRRGNRTVLAKDVQHAEELIKKGWTAEPPAHKKGAQFDLKSEEI